MKKKIFGALIVVGLVLAGIIFFGPLFRVQKESQIATPPTPTVPVFKKESISLPQPKLKGEVSLEEAIFKRRSRRDYKEKSLNLEQVSQILWVGQGITDEKTGFRSAPSAGALYPLDIYLVIGKEGIEGLAAGVYHFIPKGHKIEKTLAGDFREAVMKASLGQTFIAQAPIVLIITGEYERTTIKYGERGKQYVHMEAGHVGQNIYLEVESLGLGTVTVGAFDEDEIIKILSLPTTYRPLYVMPIGYSR